MFKYIYYQKIVFISICLVSGYVTDTNSGYYFVYGKGLKTLTSINLSSPTYTVNI